MELCASYGSFVELTQEESFIVEGGGKLREVCGYIIEYSVVAIIGVAVGCAAGALSGGNPYVAAAAGFVAGAVAGAVIDGKIRNAVNNL